MTDTGQPTKICIGQAIVIHEVLYNLCVHHTSIRPQDITLQGYVSSSLYAVRILLMHKFTERFRETLATRGMTQYALANKIHMSTQVVSGYYHGRKEPSLYVFNEICKALNEDANYLLGLTDVPK